MHDLFGAIFILHVHVRNFEISNSLQALSRALDIAFPRLLKFLVCVGVLFLSFMLCGWVVLEPFHYKVWCVLGQNDINYMFPLLHTCSPYSIHVPPTPYMFPLLHTCSPYSIRVPPTPSMLYSSELPLYIYLPLHNTCSFQTTLHHSPPSSQC